MHKKNIFNTVKVEAPPRNIFDLSHDVKMSANMGKLYPIMTLDCLPGDNISLGNQTLIRFAPMVAPIMHRINCYVHYFFVPYRIIWPNFEKWITNTPLEEGDPALPAFPFVRLTGGNYQELFDYMGIPEPAPLTQNDISAIPFFAYNKIYNEYYRDQNLQPTPLPDTCVDGENIDWDEFVCKERAWEHDYFTSALPFAQKGQSVSLPIGEITANVAVNVRNATGTTLTGAPANATVEAGADPNFALEQLYAATQGLQVGSTTINDLRTAMRVQEWLEKAARGGTRYNENTKINFGVDVGDARLNRPEYITGTLAPVKISEVLNTTGTEDAPQGTMAGHGISMTSSNVKSYYCREHGYIIGILSVMPKTAYQDGIPKHFLKINDPTERYFPSFANLGEQPILNKEVYMNHLDPNGVFGYIPRFAEHKFENNRVAGEFRNTLNFWHMGRELSNDVALNSDFISCRPTHRIFAVTDPTEDKLWMQVVNYVKASRLMPKYGIPTF